MSLSIFEALNQQIPGTAPEDDERGYCDDGQLTMHDDVFKLQLEEMGIEPDIIADVMLEPVEQRDNFLEYFRGV